MQKEEKMYFTVLPSKFIVMTIFTFGVYEVIWFYKNWKIFKEKEESNISPFWRTVFAPFFCWSLFRRINDASEHHCRTTEYNSRSQGFLYFFFNLLSNLPALFWVISFFSLIPVLNMQKTLHSINILNNHENYSTSKYSKWNIFFIILNSFFWFLIILGVFL